jgi:hypothetical protein
MMKSILAAALLVCTPLTVSAQTYVTEAPPLAEWNVQDWNPESQAACGAFMTKFGLLVSIKHQTDQVFQILFRGFALNALSEMTDPATNARAWSAPVDAISEPSKRLLSDCIDLANAALRDNLIPQSIIDDAQEEAQATLDDTQPGLLPD